MSTDTVSPLRQRHDGRYERAQTGRALSTQSHLQLQAFRCISEAIA